MNCDNWFALSPGIELGSSGLIASIFNHLTSLSSDFQLCLSAYESTFLGSKVSVEIRGLLPLPPLPPLQKSVIYSLDHVLCPTTW